MAPTSPHAGACRALWSIGFRRHLNPEEISEVVKPLLGNTAYETITWACPRDAEARVIFQTIAMRDTFNTTAVTRADLMYMDTTTGEATKLYSHMPKLHRPPTPRFTSVCNFRKLSSR